MDTGDGRGRILLRGGRLLDPTAGLDGEGDLRIDGPIVDAVAPGGGLPAGGATVVDCAGCWVFPGAVDLWARVGVPSAAGGRGELGPSLEAAARGGYTAVAPRPDTVPPHDAAPITRLIRSEAAGGVGAAVLPVGALTRGVAGERLSDVAALLDEGVVALSDGERTVHDAALFRRALEYARTFGLPVLHRGEDARLADGAVAHEGPTATRLGLLASPGAAESVVVARDVQLCALTGARLVLGPLSSAESVRLVREARARDLPVEGFASVHHLLWTDEDLGRYDVAFKRTPPLRSAADREALRDAVADGTLAAVVSGHDPPPPGRADAPFADAPGGSDALEVALPMLARLVAEGVLDAGRFVEAASIAPARILGQRRTLAVGAPADVTVLDPAATPPADALASAGNPPVRGAARLTIVHGRVAWSLAPRNGASPE